MIRDRQWPSRGICFMTQPDMAAPLPHDAVTQPLEDVGWLPVRRRREARPSSGDDGWSSMRRGSAEWRAIGQPLVARRRERRAAGDGAGRVRLGTGNRPARAPCAGGFGIADGGPSPWNPAAAAAGPPRRTGTALDGMPPALEDSSSSIPKTSATAVSAIRLRVPPPCAARVVPLLAAVSRSR